MRLVDPRTVIDNARKGGYAIAAALGVAGCVLMVAAFDTPKAHAADKMPIGVSVADQKSLFYMAAIDGIRDTAAKAG